MKNKILVLALVVATFALSGCHTVYDAKRADPVRLANEGTIVFVRPVRYAPEFGTTSIRDYVEITYERTKENQAGLLEVTVGFRNRGGRHFWDLWGPNFPLSVKAVFYEYPLSETGGPTSAPVYETNWQTLTLLRGATEHYKVICPVDAGGYYQITVSEYLK